MFQVPKGRKTEIESFVTCWIQILLKKKLHSRIYIKEKRKETQFPFLSF